jgi:2-oxoglutarate ferredoxin oxidoreductase subunit gamma
MYLDLFLAGIGGQGVLLLGQVMARAAAAEGLQVTWLPVYGVEKRGGDATCTVIISEDEIYSPVVAHPSVMVLMHSRMVPRFLPRLKECGLLITNSTLIEASEIGRNDIEVLEVPATAKAQKLGNEKVSNIVLLGALLKRTGIMPLDAVRRELLGSSKNREEQLELNLKALDIGYSL